MVGKSRFWKDAKRLVLAGRSLITTGGQVVEWLKASHSKYSRTDKTYLQ
jgi:hypothetical protein